MENGKKQSASDLVAEHTAFMKKGVFGKWKVSKLGNIKFVDGKLTIYKIANYRLKECWISHLNNKVWARPHMADFIDAYTEALNRVGIEETTFKKHL